MWSELMPTLKYNSGITLWRQKVRENSRRRREASDLILKEAFKYYLVRTWLTSDYTRNFK